MIQILDIFSGIGGLSYGLQNVLVNSEHVLYCEIDGDCQKVLVKNMDLGHLKTAPIVKDIRDLDCNPLLMNLKNVLLIAGFPCTGISTIGKKQGLEDKQSSLFYELVKVIDTVRPKFLFLENVSNILRQAQTHESVTRELTKMNYAFKEGVFSGLDVGAKHIRKRWFCLAYQDKSLIQLRKHVQQCTLKSFNWNNEPFRLIVKTQKINYMKRFMMLGNSVIPSVVEYAFLSLLFDVSPNTIKSKPCKLIFDPKLNTSEPTLSRIKRDIYTDTTGRDYWATPRTLSRASQTLTKRTILDLPTQVKFEINSTGPRDGVVNPNWLEWLMGYPKDWTKF
jgi:DNA (cytosine-5)-methyltransferase 1